MYQQCLNASNFSFLLPLSLDTNPATGYDFLKSPRMPIEIMNRKNKSRALNLIGAVFLWAVSAIAQDYHFDGTISKPVLENYLSRSISFTELLHDDLTQPRDAKGVDPRDNLRLILDTKAKFIGRSLMLWVTKATWHRF